MTTNKPVPKIEEPFQTIANGDAPRLSELLRNDPGLATQPNASGDSPLLFAAYRGQQALVEILLECGIEPDMYEATSLGDAERVEALLEEDPDQVTALSHDGWTPLHLAAHFNRREVAELLLEKGAPINATSGEDSLAPGNTPLHSAVAAGNYDMAAYLLSKKADPNAAQANGMTPLHVAAASGNPGLVQLLLDKQSNPNLVDADGFTPLTLAQQRERHEAAGLLKPLTRDPKEKA